MPNAAEPRYCRCAETIFTTVGGEVVALDVAGGHCFGFDEVASAVWELLDQPRSIVEICAKLRGQFDVGEKQCSDDVTALLEGLVRDGIVTLSTGDN